jgi:hypothetical protein
VRWPRSGRMQVFKDLPINRIVTVTEGRGTVEVRP